MFQKSPFVRDNIKGRQVNFSFYNPSTVYILGGHGTLCRHKSSLNKRLQHKNSDIFKAITDEILKAIAVEIWKLIADKILKAYNRGVRIIYYVSGLPRKGE